MRPGLFTAVVMLWLCGCGGGSDDNRPLQTLPLADLVGQWKGTCQTTVEPGGIQSSTLWLTVRPDYSFTAVRAENPNLTITGTIAPNRSVAGATAVSAQTNAHYRVVSGTITLYITHHASGQLYFDHTATSIPGALAFDAVAAKF